MIQESWSVVDGVRTRTLEVRGSGPPVLLLHGFSDHAATWRPLLQALAARGRRATAVDLPGFGRADPAAPGLLLPQLDRFVAALVAQHTEADGTAPVLVGNSLGAVAALRAAQTGCAISGVVAISPAGFGHARWIDLAEWLYPASRAVGWLPLPMWLLRPVLAGAYLRLAVGDRSRLHPRTATTYAGQFRRRADVRRVLHPAAGVLREVRAAYELEAIRCPVLLIWGTRDRLTLARGAQRLLDRVPGAELFELDGCGHCAQLEAPAEIADRIADLCERTRDRTGSTRPQED